MLALRFGRVCLHVALNGPAGRADRCLHIEHERSGPIADMLLPPLLLPDMAAKPLFEHLASAGEQCGWHGDLDGARGMSVLWVIGGAALLLSNRGGAEG
jgi:hypothetical protein